jgi:hypothetical protein
VYDRLSLLAAGSALGANDVEVTCVAGVPMRVLCDANLRLTSRASAAVDHLCVAPHLGLYNYKV